MVAMTSTADVVLAIDAGTGSARALAFDLAGTLIAQSSVEWTHTTVPGHPGGTAFDPAAGWDAVTNAVRSAVARLGSRRVVAIAASSMREGFVLFDDDGNEIWACPNTDGRARAQADQLLAEGLAGDIYATAGDWVSITAPARLRWIAEHQPQVLSQARHLGMLSDWVNYRLTGEFLTDPTCGSSSAMFDLARRDWSIDLVERIGVNPQILPAVVEPGTIIGGVHAAAARATGLPVGTPVVMGGADTQLALHAIGADRNRPTIVAGTFWQTTAVTQSPVIDPLRRTRTLCHVDSQSWMVEGIGFLSGLAMRWFRDGFCPDAAQFARGDGVSAFDVMESWAADVPAGSNGLVAVMSDVMQSDAWHHAAPALVGFDITDPTRFNRGTVVRAIEEAAAFVAASHLDILTELTGGAATAIGEVTFTGGSSAGALWPAIIAGVTNLTTRTTQAPEATSYGAARLAATGVGTTLPALAMDDHPVIAEPDDIAAYRAHRNLWHDVYREQRALTARLGLTPLFTPPGAARGPLTNP